MKNAGLRSVRSACGTTWSEVADFAEQDTRISSGGRPLTAGNSSTWEDCNIYIYIYMIIIDFTCIIHAHIFIQSSVDIYDLILHIYL